MRVRAKRFFISSVLGNVDEGQVLTVSDAHGKHLIENGLADRITSAGPEGEGSAIIRHPLGSPAPAPAAQKPTLGSSLLVGQASQGQTVKSSECGNPEPKSQEQKQAKAREDAKSKFHKKSGRSRS